jgi:hypothetical protein
MIQSLQELRNQKLLKVPSLELKAWLHEDNLGSGERRTYLTELRIRALSLKCSKHPRYRGMSPPPESRKCDKCEEIWEAWQF